MPFEAGRVRVSGKAELLVIAREERAQRESARARTRAALHVRASSVTRAVPTQNPT
jgi:hypothetical protein